MNHRSRIDFPFYAKIIVYYTIHSFSIHFVDREYAEAYTVRDIFEVLENLTATHPNLCDLFTIGYSYENRPLYVLR